MGIDVGAWLLMWGRGDKFAIGVSVSFVDKCVGG